MACRSAWLSILLAFTLMVCGLQIAACQPAHEKQEQPQVDINQYQNFWLWGAVPSSTFVKPPQQLYILQGEIGWSHLQQRSTLQPQGMGLGVLPARQVWLVYRTTHLNWSAGNVQAIIKRLDSWQNRGNQVVGLQIDFDAATRHLDSYASFLQTIRQQLPARYQLSVTGLLDWVNHPQAQTFVQLDHVVDEIVLQTYQGKSTIPDYQQYMQRLAQLKQPFKIGLVANGHWLGNPHIEKNPYFRGYVVFLPASSAR